MIKKKVTDFVREECKALQNDQDKMKDPFKYIETLRVLNNDLKKINEKCFEGKNLFEKTWTEMFKSFLRERNQHFASTYLAQYIDQEMRKKENEDVQKTILVELMYLFLCLPQADLFIRAYEKEYASRLITKSSANDNLEEFLITRFKNECGEQLVTRLHELRQDYKYRNT